MQPPRFDLNTAPPKQSEDEADLTTHARRVPFPVFIVIGVAMLVVLGTLLAVVFASLAH